MIKIYNRGLGLIQLICSNKREAGSSIAIWNRELVLIVGKWSGDMWLSDKDFTIMENITSRLKC